MGAKSSIQWTDATWNPIRGCSMAKGSETGGCLNCYAARMAARNLPGMRSPSTGKPFAILRDSRPRWTGEVELIEKALSLPMTWRKPRKVFVNSMSDLFHENLSDADILSVFQVMGKCPAHTFQILTKRPERALKFLSARRWRNLGHSPQMGGNHYVAILPGEHSTADEPCLPNVWIGVSIEDQFTANARLPFLLRTPAEMRFVSYEPALGPVDFFAIRQAMEDNEPSREQLDGPLGIHYVRHGAPFIDLIIVGGESGPSARAFDLAWARNTIEQCGRAGVSCFVRQLGRQPHDTSDGSDRPNAGTLIDLKDRSGGDWDEWPADLRVRRLPAPLGDPIAKAGEVR